MSWLTEHLRQPTTPPTSPAPPPIQSSEDPKEDPKRGSVEWYGFKYAEAELKLGQRADVLMNAVEDIIKNKARYQEVEVYTKVPWYLIGALHCRESDFNFSTYLGNGDPLSKPTIHVPKSRGPFSSWISGAIDSLDYDKLSGRKDWTIPLCLLHAEAFNGEGYMNNHPDVMSPYLWSMTSLYTKGKYDYDDGNKGHFNPSKVDAQPGVAAIFKELQIRGVI